MQTAVVVEAVVVVVPDVDVVVVEVFVTRVDASVDVAAKFSDASPVGLVGKALG